MTKDEILAKSRIENAGKDIEDLEVQKTATAAGYFSSFGLCILVTVLNLIFAKKVNFQCWIVFFGMLSIAFFVKFAKLKKLHELVVAICYTVIFSLLVIMYVFELTGKLTF